MKVFILTGGNKEIGLGHIMRCLSLADAFQEKNICPTLLVDSDSDIEGLFKSRKYLMLKWLDGDSKFFRFIEGADIAIVDTYSANSMFYKKMSEAVRTPVYFDDYNRIDYIKGIVLNGNIYAEELTYPKRNGLKYLLGTRYVPLRKEFWIGANRKVRERVKNIMVTCGGSDPEGMMPVIIKTLGKNFPDCVKKVIVSKCFKDKNIERIKRLKNKKTEILFWPDPNVIRKTMTDCDIAVSSGGQTLYELARVGTPAAGFCVADNQKLILEKLHKVGFLEYIGWYYEKGLLDNLVGAISTKLFSVSERTNRGAIGMRYVDGQGARRVIDEVS